jgi:hypothetical protein
MKKIYPIEIEGKIHHIKVSGLFHKAREVYPIKNEDGKINWKNLLIGSVQQLISLLIYLAIAALIYFGMQQIVQQCNYAINNPCELCANLTKIDLSSTKYVSTGIY